MGHSESALNQREGTDATVAGKGVEVVLGDDLGCLNYLYSSLRLDYREAPWLK